MATTPPAPSRAGFAVPPVITWTLVTVGAFLVYASILGLSPMDELRAALGGKKGPGRKPLSPLLTELGATNDGSAVSYPSRAASVAAGATSADSMVSGDGTPLLRRDALTGFLAWQTAYGSKIVGSGWRSLEQQAAGYASDPDRFAAPDKSWHPKGLAVDVDLAASGAAMGPGGAVSPGFARLYAAALATGWCNPRGPYKGDHKEPWHFSFGGCG